MGMALFLVWIICLAIYFLPTIVAFSNKKCGNKVGVFFLNFLLGWTFIAWVIALVMACSSGHQTVIINNGAGDTKTNK